MRVQTKAPSGPWKSRPQGMRRWASVRQAPAIAVFVAITMFAAPVLAAESVLTLEDALERALLHHPAMWDADAEALQTELAWERQQARRRLQASVRTTVIGASFDPVRTTASDVSSWTDARSPRHLQRRLADRRGDVFVAVGGGGRKPLRARKRSVTDYLKPAALAQSESVRRRTGAPKRLGGSGGASGSGSRGEGLGLVGCLPAL